MKDETPPSYTPKLPPRQWAQIQEFVEQAVDAVTNQTTYKRVDLLLATSRLVEWTFNTAGLPLDRETVFRREIVDRFIAVGCEGQTAASRGNTRSQLLRVSENLLGPRLAPVRLRPLTAAAPAEPYSELELRILRTWTTTASTASRRANASVLLALGMGAGLSGGEIGALVCGEIEVDEIGVVIRVGGSRPRRVPVIRGWESALIARKEQLRPEQFAFRPEHTVNYPNLVSSFVTRAGPKEVRVRSQRLRSTWIVRHLEAATPVAALMEAAGVESLEALTRYMQFVEPPDSAEARRRLMLSSPQAERQ